MRPVPKAACRSRSTAAGASVRTDRRAPASSQLTVDSRRSAAPSSRAADDSRNGSGGVPVSSGTAGAGDVPALDYGETTSAHGFTCESAESGVTCRHDESGYGFTVARAAYELF